MFSFFLSCILHTLLADDLTNPFYPIFVQQCMLDMLQANNAITATPIISVFVVLSEHAG